MKIIISGSIALDRIMIFNGRYKDVIQPDKLHVLSLSLLLDDLKETPGGVAANIAYSLALLGEKPSLLGSVGKNGQAYMAQLAGKGVDTSVVHYSQLPTASFSVITDLDDCQVGGFYPGAMGDSASLSLKPWKNEPALIIISPHDPAQMKKQVAECQKYALRLFYDVGQQVSNIPAQDIREGIEAAELLIVNDYEMGVIIQKTGWSQAQIMDKVKVCVITLGAQGCQIFADGQAFTVPAARCAKVVDPTGAGDAFRAGFIYGYVREWSPDACARLGSVVAWYCLKQIGTQTHTFTTEEIVTRFFKVYQQKITL